MNKTRLETFSDGVLAIIITIMVLELKIPAGTSWDAIKPLFPTLASYVLSFIFIAIYWGNHHHLLHTLNRVNGKIIWANMHLLFWLSLVPFGTRWMGENNFDSVTVAVYGTLLVLCDVAFTLLAVFIARGHPNEAEFARIFQKSKLKATISTILYLLSIPLAFVNPVISCSIFVFVALIWFIPDKEIEKLLSEM
ncbi:MAG TPA: TMEM175 family protein [Candidatus Kapabacteria bacterium]|nr:TMEM175 family protein [Candidatus Kapabacteria bacterium]